MIKLPKVTVWNEFQQEKTDKPVARVYPQGIHSVIAKYLKSEGFPVQTATLDEKEHGLTEKTLSETDVLIWWGHRSHQDVSDDIVNRIYQRVVDAMGLIGIHSSHLSKIFVKLMGTSCLLGSWREDGKKESIWVIEHNHPIANGLGPSFEIPQTEMYSERFDVPNPDTLVFISSFEEGEVFRSGCCYNRGLGKIFYFRPGHETYPIFFQKEVQQVIKNAVLWATPQTEIKATEEWTTRIKK